MVNKIPETLTRQFANLNRLETMTEEQQSGNGCASTGEVCISAEKVKGAISAKNSEIPQMKDQNKQCTDQEIHALDGSTKVNNGSKRKRGRPKKHIGERSTGANMDMKDSYAGDEAKSSAENAFLMSTTVDEIPKNGDFQPSIMELISVTFQCPRKPKSGVRKPNPVFRKKASSPLFEDRADETVERTSESNGHGELTKTVDTESQYQDSHEIDHTKYDGMMIDEDGDTDDDQPLSACLNLRPPIGSDYSRTLPGKRDGNGTPPIDQEHAMESSLRQKMDGPISAIIPNPADSHEIDHTKYVGTMTDEDGDTDDDQPLSMCLNLRPPIGSNYSRTLPVGKRDGNGTPPIDQENAMESSLRQKMDGPISAIIPNPADSHEIVHTKYDGTMIEEDGDTDDDQPLSMCLNLRPPIGSDYSRTLPVGKRDGNGTPPIDQENAMESSLRQKMDGPISAIIPNPADSHEIDHTKYDGMMIDEDGDTDDDQPLSTCFNLRPPIGSDYSRSLPVGKEDGNGTPPINQENTVKSSLCQKTDGPRDIPDLNQCPKSNDEGGELGPPATVSTDTMENEESLSFVESSSIWKYIYSRETYKKMRLKPHFNPLKEHEEKFREGMAIGLMISFSDLMKDISKLQDSSDITAVQRHLKNLAEFKSHGFDVDKVEADLTQILSTIQRAEELRKEYGHIESKISDSVGKDKLADEELIQLRQIIRESEKKIGETILNKENMKKALSAMQSERDAVAENLQCVRVEFETLVGSFR